MGVNFVIDSNFWSIFETDPLKNGRNTKYEEPLLFPIQPNLCSTTKKNE